MSCCFTPSASPTLRDLPEIPIFNSKLPMDAQFYADIRPPPCREYYIMCCYQYCPLVANGYCLWCNNVSDTCCPDNIFTLVKGVEVGILDSRVYRRDDPLLRFQNNNDNEGGGNGSSGNGTSVGSGVISSTSSSSGSKKAPLLVAVKILRGRTLSNASNPSTSSSYMSANQQSEDSEGQMIEKTGFITLENLDVACCFDITNSTLNLPIAGTVNESLDIRKEAEVALDERMITTATHRYPHIYRACNGSMLAFVVILSPGDKVQLLGNEVQFLGDLRLPEWKNYVVKAKVLEVQDVRLRGLIGSLCWVNVEDFDVKQYLDRQNLLMHIPMKSPTETSTVSSSVTAGSGLNVTISSISHGAGGSSGSLHSPSNRTTASGSGSNNSPTRPVPIPQSPSLSSTHSDQQISHSPSTGTEVYSSTSGQSPKENINVNVKHVPNTFPNVTEVTKPPLPPNKPVSANKENLHLQLHYVGSSSVSVPSSGVAHVKTSYLCEGSIVMVQQTVIGAATGKELHSSFCFDTTIVGAIALMKGQFAIRVTLKSPFVYTVLSNSATNRHQNGERQESEEDNNEEEIGLNTFVLDFNTEMDRNNFLAFITSSQQQHYQAASKGNKEHSDDTTPIPPKKPGIKTPGGVPVVPVPIQKRKKGPKRKSRGKPLTTLSSIPEEPSNMKRLPADHEDSDEENGFDMDESDRGSSMGGNGSEHNGESLLRGDDEDEEESRPLSSMIEY